MGVCEKDKTTSKPLDRKPSVPLNKILNMVAAGAASDDICSTLASRLTRLDRQISDPERAKIAKQADGRDIMALSGELLKAIDPDALVEAASRRFLPGEDQQRRDAASTWQPTEEQLDQIEQQAMQAALNPFHDPKLRQAILDARDSLQVIDEVTQDQLLLAGHSKEAKEKAQTILANFRRFIDDHKDEIEALQILYSRPYRAGLRYGQVKELAEAVKRPPVAAPLERLWQAYEAVEPEKVKGHGGRQLVDVVALVRHAIDPNLPLVPVGTTVEERYQQWLTRQTEAGVAFTAEQRKWLDAIKNHIASSLHIEQDTFDDLPFNQMGGLNRAYELFGEGLSGILEELNEGLAA